VQLLLDTHIIIGVVEDDIQELDPTIREILLTPESELSCSVATLWEIAIKFRLGKLPLRIPLLRLKAVVENYGISLLAIQPGHVLAEVDPLPATRDPFDRLLLGQCLVENLRLVTIDRALAAHPLAWRPA
jgi:PIN domain nuclease of toxin-antitoxin system